MPASGAQVEDAEDQRVRNTRLTVAKQAHLYESLQVDQILSPDPTWARERANAGTCQHARPATISLRLVRQYEPVNAEVKELRNSPVGTLVAEMRRARQRGYRSPIDA